MAPPNSETHLQKELVHVDSSFEPLMPKFLANRKKEVTAMQAAMVELDFETVRKISHGMKGAGGSYGLDRVSEMAAVIEQAAKAADAAIIMREMPRLEDYLARVEVVYE
ncbi:MAG: Hpt domain-containing protein [Nitrospira sp.]|nr:Hpt domain-containing protein [Nitrospira sp.]